MVAHTRSSKSIETCRVIRGLTAFCSGTATVLFGVVVAKRSVAASYGAGIDWAWDCLPLVGLGCSTVWNLLSFFVLCSGKYFYFPRRFHLIADALTAVVLVVLGYTSLAYNRITEEQARASPLTRVETRLQMGGLALLSAVCVAHFTFFCHGCKKSNKADKKAEVAPPQYSPGLIQWNTENPFSDDRSTRSLPRYEAGDYEKVDIEKKGLAVRVMEVDNCVV